VRRLSHEMHYSGDGNEVVVYYALNPFNHAISGSRSHSLMQ